MDQYQNEANKTKLLIKAKLKSETIPVNEIYQIIPLWWLKYICFSTFVRNKLVHRLHNTYFKLANCYLKKILL